MHTTAAARVRLRVLSWDPLAHVSVSLTPGALRHPHCLRRIGSHTTEVRVHNKPGVAQRHRFCRFAVLPFLHPHEASCGSLLDAGARVEGGSAAENAGLPRG